VCKGEVWIFEQVIHQDDQLPHDRRERDFGGFARRNQPVVKRLEQVIAPAGRQRAPFRARRFSICEPRAALADSLALSWFILAPSARLTATSDRTRPSGKACGSHYEFESCQIPRVG